MSKERDAWLALAICLGFGFLILGIASDHWPVRLLLMGTGMAGLLGAVLRTSRLR